MSSFEFYVAQAAVVFCISAIIAFLFSMLFGRRR